MTKKKNLNKTNPTLILAFHESWDVHRIGNSQEFYQTSERLTKIPEFPTIKFLDTENTDF